MQSPWLQQRKVAHAKKQIKKLSSNDKRRLWWQSKLEHIKRKRTEKQLAIEDMGFLLFSHADAFIQTAFFHLLLFLRTRRLMQTTGLLFRLRTGLFLLGGPRARY